MYYSANLIEKGHLGALAGNLLELCIDVFGLEVLVDERADLGELVEPSSAAGLCGTCCTIMYTPITHVHNKFLVLQTYPGAESPSP